MPRVEPGLSVAPQSQRLGGRHWCWHPGVAMPRDGVGDAPTNIPLVRSLLVTESKRRDVSYPSMVASALNEIMSIFKVQYPKHRRQLPHYSAGESGGILKIPVALLVHHFSTCVACRRGSLFIFKARSCFHFSSKDPPAWIWVGYPSNSSMGTSVLATWE